MASNDEAGVSGWQDESRGESIESMETGLGKETEVRAGQTVVDASRSKVTSGRSLGYFERK